MNITELLQKQPQELTPIEYLIWKEYIKTGQKNKLDANKALEELNNLRSEKENHNDK